MKVEDNAFFALRPEVGGIAWLHSSWTEWKNLFSLEITLERAKIEVTGLGGSYGTERLTLYEMGPQLGPPKTSELTWPGPDESWRDELEDFVGKIRGLRTKGATMDDAIAVRSIIDEAYAS
jgi:predicted dehydrogenase